MTDLPSFHPRRFQILVGRTLSREFQVKLETMRMMRTRGRGDRQAIRSELIAKEFGQFSTAEILERQRREAALGSIHRKWRECGQVSFDISETLSNEPTGSTLVDSLPAIEELPRSFFVHFGKQPMLQSNEQEGPYIEGAYVCTYLDHGPGYFEFAFVCGHPTGVPLSSLGEILAVQSCTATGLLSNTSVSSIGNGGGVSDTDERLRPLIYQAGNWLERSFVNIAAADVWRNPSIRV